MSDTSQILTEGYGTPLAWIYTPEGEVLRDYDGQPISKYLTEFEYEYDEESDDTCNMTFMFEDLRSFELPYFQQDVILQVKWGYVLPEGKTLFSPLRKIAIRDLEANYKTDGLKLQLMCTDLVAYIKNNQTQTISNYQNPLAEENIKIIDTVYDNFIDYLTEIKGRKYKATITVGQQALFIDKMGQKRGYEYDKKHGNYREAQDNLRVVRDMHLIFETEKVIKGNSQALPNAIEAQLKFINDLNAEKENNQGQLFMDSTDDVIEVKQRNYEQNVWKSFTFYGGTGELLSFSSNTNTRKNKSDVAANTGVNPFNKKIESSAVSTFDTTNKGQLPPLLSPNTHSYEQRGDDQEIIRPTDNPFKQITQGYRKFISRKEPTPEQLKEHVQEFAKVFEKNIQNPFNQEDLPALKFNYVELDADRYMGMPVDKTRTMTISSKVLLNMPEFMSMAEDLVSEKKAQIRREMGLINYTVEKIQRKYEADAEVIGDPSLIKGKIISINNVGPLDRGKWYIVRCSHRISREKGYICEMNLLRKPSTVNTALSRNAINPVFDREEDAITFEYENEIKGYTFFKDIKKNDVNSSIDMDDRYDDRYKVDTEASIENRLESLQSTEDFRAGNQPNNNITYVNPGNQPNNSNY